MEFISDELFLNAAEQSIAALPRWVRESLHNLAFFVEDYPSREIQASMQMESRNDLLGLYVGVPISARGSQYGYGEMPDAIYLYRHPIMRYCAESGEDWRYCVNHVVIHEVGHYLGLSDDEMEAIEQSS